MKLTFFAVKSVRPSCKETLHVTEVFVVIFFGFELNIRLVILGCKTLKAREAAVVSEVNAYSL